MSRILLINPWITDVAAYDLWAWPLGLLYWAAHLRSLGHEVALIDCTDRAHPAVRKITPPPRKFGTGKYHSEPFPIQPEPARQAGKIFKRYGLPVDAFEEELTLFENNADPPDAVLVTCRMTYWYHGAADVIGRVKRRWPNTPVALGGTYASLCPDHARKHTQADEIFDNRNPLTASEWLSRHLSSGPVPTLPENLSNWPRPAVDLCHSRQTLPLLTSLGCPFRCSYCASSRLAPSYQRRTAEDLFEEFFEHALRSQTTDFAFYDDALLVDADRYIQPFFELVIAENLPCRFHTPNGLHYTLITPGLAHTMRQAGVTTIRLSLETVSPKNLAAWNRSGDKDVFRRSVTSLLEAGYAREEIGAYVLAGMPGQTVDEVRRSIDLAHEAGATPKVNEYSPIPGTTEWPRSLALSGPEIEAEPLWQNNSLYHTRGEIFDVPTLQTLKALSHQTP